MNEGGNPAAEAPVELVGQSPVDQHANRRVSALMVDLMLRDGIPPHVIGGALIANLTLVLCSACPTVALANRALNEAAAALKANKRLAPKLVAQAAAGRHAAEPALKAGVQ